MSSVSASGASCRKRRDRPCSSKTVVTCSCGSESTIDCAVDLSPRNPAIRCCLFHSNAHDQHSACGCRRIEHRKKSSAVAACILMSQVETVCMKPFQDAFPQSDRRVCKNGRNSPGHHHPRSESLLYVMRKKNAIRWYRASSKIR